MEAQRGQGFPEHHTAATGAVISLNPPASHRAVFILSPWQPSYTAGGLLRRGCSELSLPFQLGSWNVLPADGINWVLSGSRSVPTALIVAAWKPDLPSAGPQVSRSTSESESIYRTLALPSGWLLHLAFTGLAAASDQVRLPSAVGRNSSNFQVSSQTHLPLPAPRKIMIFFWL